MSNTIKLKNIILNKEFESFLSYFKNVDNINLNFLSNEIDLINILLSNNKTADFLFNNNILTIASQNGNLELVKILLNQKNQNIDIFNYSFVFATHNEHFDIVKLLLKDSRLKQEDNDNLLLDIVISKNNIDIAKIILNNDNVAKNIKSNNLLDAIKNNSYDMAKLIYENKYLKDKLNKIEISTYNDFSIKHLTNNLTFF